MEVPRPGRVELGNLTIDYAAGEVLVKCRSQTSTLRLILDSAFWGGRKASGEEGTAVEIVFPDSDSRLAIEETVTDGLTQYRVSLSSTRPETSLGVTAALNSGHWYGGTTSANQKWPLSDWNTGPDLPFTTSDIYTSPLGGVMEPYWLCSTRTAISLPSHSPLLFSYHGDQRAMRWRLDSTHPTYQSCSTENAAGLRQLELNIWLPCSASTTLSQFHLRLLELHFDKPKRCPDRETLAGPLWSTWACFKTELSQEKVVDFARKIADSGLGGTQLGIDDGWSSAQGDLVMHPDKFPNPKLMVEQLSLLGLRASLWVHPFANWDSSTAQDPSASSYWVSSSGKPAEVNWWNGRGLMLDVSKPEALHWFQGKLASLQKDLGIFSFKFDAGEFNWVPRDALLPRLRHPNEFSEKFVQFASRFGNSVEVRVGSGSQGEGSLVRVMDKESRWDAQNGLASLLPSVFTIGLLGYPFVLPDMIGGNAYQGRPSEELFIRWTQASALMPAIQFSIPPWDYGPRALRIAQSMMVLRKMFLPLILELAEEAVLTGAPIVRPMWWEDESAWALQTSSQFALGSDVVVAPVLEEGREERVVYFPAGEWLRVAATTGEHLGSVVIGPNTVSVPAPLHSLPVFVRRNSSLLTSELLSPLLISDITQSVRRI